ncbi:MAG: hypothetical protein FWB75_02380, partial [Oscillospiraceae bacterium]|nr:hypothetical protein [Oscillospiraceae bacterium]
MNIDNEQNMDMKQPADVPEILSAETSPEITSEISEQPHEAHHVHVHVTRHQQYENNHGSSYGETPIAPEITAPQEVSEIPDAVAIPETAEVPEAVEIPEVIEAPEISEVAGSYTAQETAEASAEKQDVQEWGLRRRGDINPENKSPAEEREPSYRDAAYCVPKNNMANMYSPGGHTRHHNHHLEYDRRRGDRRRGDRRAEDRRADDRRGYDRRATDNVYNMERSDEQEPVKRKGKRAGIGFLRAACIVLVCAIFSA